MLLHSTLLPVMMPSVMSEQTEPPEQPNEQVQHRPLIVQLFTMTHGLSLLARVRRPRSSATTTIMQEMRGSLGREQVIALSATTARLPRPLTRHRSTLLALCATIAIRASDTPADHTAGVAALVAQNDGRRG